MARKGFTSYIVTAAVIAALLGCTGRATPAHAGLFDFGRRKVRMARLMERMARSLATCDHYIEEQRRGLAATPEQRETLGRWIEARERTIKELLGASFPSYLEVRELLRSNAPAASAQE